LFNFIGNALGQWSQSSQESEPGAPGLDVSVPGIPMPGRIDPIPATDSPSVGEERRWFGVAALGRITDLQQREWLAFRHGHAAPPSGRVVDWPSFCTELGARVVSDGYSAYGTRSSTVGEAFYQGARSVLGGEAEAWSVCHLMSELPVNARQRRLMRATFLKDAHVGVVVGGTLGTREECEILSAAGGVALPIGASGGTAFMLWSRLVAEYAIQLTRELLTAFEGLGDPTRTKEDHLNAVTRIVEAHYARRLGSRAGSR
jgi:hypothetical protein